jgi:hypothetical protein
MDAADDLNKAQAQVTTGWKKWLRDNRVCSVRTAFVCQQLANNRARIEAEIEQSTISSVRDALALIGDRRPPKKKPEKPRAKAPEHPPGPAMPNNDFQDGGSVTVLIEMLREIITDEGQLPGLRFLSPHKRKQAQKLIERLQADLYDLVDLRNAVAKATPDVMPPPADDDGHGASHLRLVHGAEGAA